MSDDEKKPWETDEVADVLKEQERQKNKPGKTNIDGVKKITTPQRVINFDRLAYFYSVACQSSAPPKGIAEAYGIKFKTPRRMTLDEVCEKNCLIPMDFTSKEMVEIVLVNEIVRMSPEAAAYLQETEGGVGPSHFLVTGLNTVHLPHRFYVAYRRDGAPITAAGNLGKDKGTGQKDASRPEVKKITN